MVWHNANRNNDGLVRHVVDGKAWAHIDVTWLEFVAKPCNVRLGLVTNGVNPFGAQNSSWSIWPFMLQIYNPPPWLVTKKNLVILTLIIPSKEFMKMHNIDVYMAPLIEELQVLWKGVATYDVARVEGQGYFTLRTILMWTSMISQHMGLWLDVYTKVTKLVQFVGQI
jgi:hypothetical protein